MPPLLWRKWLLFKKILQKDFKPKPHTHLVCHRPNAPLGIWTCTWLEKIYQEDVDIAMAKRKKKEKATKVNSVYTNKECFSRTNVSLLLKESQLECHQKRQNHFNITAVTHSSFISTEAWSQICPREWGKIPSIVRKWSGLVSITLEREN